MKKDMATDRERREMVNKTKPQIMKSKAFLFAEIFAKEFFVGWKEQKLLFRVTKYVINGLITASYKLQKYQ